MDVHVSAKLPTHAPPMLVSGAIPRLTDPLEDEYCLGGRAESASRGFRRTPGGVGVVESAGILLSLTGIVRD